MRLTTPLNCLIFIAMAMDKWMRENEILGEKSVPVSHPTQIHTKLN
jgi:hypothetical protein